MTHYRMLDRDPSAVICVDGNEKKIYQEGQIFLNNGDNFQVRMFNPLQTKIGVEIIFNGQKKNDGLLVLNPGQDVTLDRFLGEKKKMRYETYTIDGNNSAAVQAAALNGLVEFKFYKEKINYNCYYSNTNNWNWNTTPIYGSSTIRGVVSHSDYSTTNSSTDLNKTSKLKSKCIKQEVETGRVEKGPESNQNLSTIDANFETFPFHIISYQLKPNSQFSDLKEVRQYCTGCGYRLRKQSWNFCPKCSLPL